MAVRSPLKRAHLPRLSDQPLILGWWYLGLEGAIQEMPPQARPTRRSRNGDTRRTSDDTCVERTGI
jgi:hypothetical protein